MRYRGHAEADGNRNPARQLHRSRKRQFTEVAESFPDECLYVLESLGAVYGFDAETKERGLTPEERLKFHQTHSAPVMEELHQGMKAQFAEHKRNRTPAWAGNLLFSEALDEADVVFAATGRPAR